MRDEYKLAMGRAVKQLRVKHGINQSKLAEMIGVSRSFISDVEVGRAKLSIERVIELCEKFDESMEFFNPIPRSKKYLSKKDENT